MDSHSSQYDSSIGGHVDVPDTESTFQYAEKRLPELASLISTVKNPTKSKLIFQSMPRHMRRRTAAQNPKRLPVRLRQGHMSQLRKSGTPTEKKRPSRKYRRRASNLRKEYARRQMKSSWLETHIWHAKRFHMVKKWGYKIPWAPCDKSYRACYRASMRHCLIQDVSYLTCLEIRGCLEELSQLKRLCNPTELSFVARSFLSGEREGIVDVFQRDKYPFGAIGQVSFFWKPPVQDELRILWMFVHPAFLEAIKRQLAELFSLQRTQDTQMDDNEDPPDFTNASGSVQIRDLSQKINRFRLTGPLSHSVLSHALKGKENPRIETDVSEEAHKAQQKYWREISNLTSPAELPSNMILALQVEDPRINRPQKRTKATPEGSILPNTILRIPPLINISALWDPVVRRRLPQDIMNTEKYNEKRRKECLTPGERCPFEENLQAMPLLLVQRPGCQGFASGWDVIVLQGYGVITWISLIMWGARAGGWRDTVSMLKELGREAFQPDTEAGATEDASQAEELLAKYFRKPAKKRPNYTKLSIACPFQCPWEQLVDEWSQSPAESFYVLRDRRILELCEKALKYQVALNAIKLEESVLIPVSVRMISRGNPGNFSILALPTAQELKHSGERDPLYTEPLVKDPRQRMRNSLRLKHRRFLKQQRRLRVRAKRKEEEKSNERVKIPWERSQIVAAECIKFKEKMQELWLPEKPTSIKDQCSRTVIGYVTQCDFSFTDSIVSGIGYVTWNGFRELIETCRKRKQVTILVRGTKTRHYRGGNISIKLQK